MNKFFSQFDKLYIGIETADGRRHCIRGWYLDQRLKHDECPRGYHMCEFRSSDGDGEYLCTIEPMVWVNHSGTFVTRTEIPFNMDGNPDCFEVKYGHFY